MICTTCQTPNPDGAKFCNNCGGRLAVACPICGHANPPGSKFCNNCGARLEVAAQSIEPPVAQAHPKSPVDHSDSLDRYLPPELRAKLETAHRSGLGAGERRIVTMLFCDVAGSTAAAGRLDPEEWAEVINGAFQHMIEPIYRYEGTVARLMGDGLLAFFGAPMTPLSQGDSSRLVDTLLAWSLVPAALRTRILDQAAGNPFFVEEVIRALLDNPLKSATGLTTLGEKSTVACSSAVHSSTL